MARNNLARIAKLEIKHGAMCKNMVNTVALEGIITHVPDTYTEYIGKQVYILREAYPDIDFFIVDFV